MEGKINTQRGPASSLERRPHPSELSLGLTGVVQVGGAFWWLRRVRLYADPYVNPPRYTATAFLERRRDQQGDPLEPTPRAALELRGDGTTLAEACAALAQQILPACVALEGES